MSGLQIAPELTLELDAVTQTFALLAMIGAGKSNAAVVMAEEMYDAGVPWVAIDPKGDWWGVRAAGDGRGEGLSVIVFGGEHGDVPLEPTAGNLVADLIAEQRITCVLDVSEMSKADQRRFLTDFATRLYKRNREPLHLFCEEADEYIPQRVMGEVAKVVGAMETLVKRGRFRGIGVTLVTQRSASLNKDVLTQTGTLIALRTTSPQDRKAIRDWIDYHASSRDVIDELPALANGEAWVSSPHFLHQLVKIRFRRRRTFDSGATPTIGGKPRPPARLADVDLAAIKESMAETIERAKADDPKELRKQLTEVRQQLAQVQRDLAAERAAERTRVEHVSVFTDQDRDAIYELAEQTERMQRTVAALKEKTHDVQPAAGAQTSVTDRPTAPRPATRIAAPTVTPETDRRPAGDGTLSKSEKALLTGLALRGPTLARKSLGAIAGYSWKSGGFRNSLSSLRTKGYLDGSDPVTITDAGREALGTPPAMPTGRELLNFWTARIGKAERAIAEVLYEAYPGTLTREQVADACGYTVTSGGFRNALSRLRTLGLVDPGDPLRASDELGASD